jgi:hypothetical protein
VVVILLAAAGVPLWLCALAILALVFRDRSLRKRPGNVPVRLRRPGSRRWRRGHAVWTHDVLSFRGSPAAWQQELVWVVSGEARAATAAERRQLRRIGDRPIIACFTLQDGGTIEVAARSQHADRLLDAFRESAPA